MPIIKIKNLVKKFNDFKAVDGISFEVNEGEIFGFLGPNGAGKTTTISMLATILEPSSGTAAINCFDITRQRSDVRKSIGVIFQDPSLDEELTAYENLVFHAVMYDISMDVARKRITELLKLVDLEDRKNDLVRAFSGGMKRRLEIARGMMHHPKILFLDEPTVGLDPQTRNHIWGYLQKLNEKENMTVILTTHYMEEADKLCDRIAVIDHGKIIAVDTSQKLKSVLKGDLISFECSDAKKFSARLKKERWVKKIKIRDGTIDLEAENIDGNLAKLVKLSNDINVKIKSLSVHKPTLEDVFLSLTGKTIREEEASSKDTMRQAIKMWRR